MILNLIFKTLNKWFNNTATFRDWTFAGNGHLFLFLINIF